MSLSLSSSAWAWGTAMFFKILSLSILLLLSLTDLFSEENLKWNILIGQWSDLSINPDPSISSMIQRSLKNNLDRDPSFNASIKEGGSPSLLTPTFSEYRLAGLSNQSDIVIMGFYYIEGSSIAISTTVYDVLSNQVRMSRIYRGQVTADIFDTIDEITTDIGERIRQVLPAITMDSAENVRTIRRNLYQPTEARVRRTFFTGIGLYSHFMDVSSYGDNLNTNFNLNLFTPSLDLMFRIEDFRLDIQVSPPGGFPTYEANQGWISSGTPVALNQIVLSYYPPFLNDQWSIGIGLLPFQHVIKSPENNSYQSYETRGAEFLQTLSLQLSWSPFSMLETHIQLTIPNTIERVYDEFNSTNIRHEEVKTLLPLMNLSIVWFPFKEIGFQFKVMACDFEYHTFETTQDGTFFRDEGYHRSIRLSAYLGALYRVDFLKGI